MTDSCPALRSAIGAAIVGDLTDDEQARLDAHLARCAACAADLAQLSVLPDLLELTRTEEPQVPADLRDRIVAASGRRPPRRARVLLTTAAVLVGIVLGATGVALLALPIPPDPDRRVELAAGDGQGSLGGHAELRDTPAGVHVDLEAHGFDPSHRVGYYEVWLERPDGHRVSAGTVLADGDGTVAASLTCGGLLEDYDTLTVTVRRSYDGGEDVVMRRAIP